jgi:hypothetical protein
VSAAANMESLIAWLDWSTQSGHCDATLIPWDAGNHDSEREIADARAALELVGWIWNPILEQLERGGWYAWFRSQGKLASPIIQWGRLNVPLPTDEPARLQLTLF